VLGVAPQMSDQASPPTAGREAEGRSLGFFKSAYRSAGDTMPNINEGHRHHDGHLQHLMPKMPSEAAAKVDAALKAAQKNCS
jgi:hypothetical protein